MKIFLLFGAMSSVFFWYYFSLPYCIYKGCLIHSLIQFFGNFELTKKRSRMYPAKTITDANYADDIAILANTPNQAETLLHSLERAAAGIGLLVNAHKTEYMCFNQAGDISTLDETSLKLVDKFTYGNHRVINPLEALKRFHQACFRRILNMK